MMIEARIGRALLAAFLAGVSTSSAAAQFANPFTPAFRGQPNTELSGWDVFQFADGTPNVPDDPGTTSDDATLSQVFLNAFVDASGDIQGLDFLAFSVDDTLPGDLQEVVLQTASSAPHRNPTSFVLIYVDGGGTPHGLAPAEVTTRFESGVHKELLVRWDVSGVAEEVLAYALSFVNGGPNGSLAGALLDTRFAQPIELVFCDATDDALAACPCGNAGSPDTGCDIAQATGGVGLEVLAQTSAPNAATLRGTGFPTTSTPTAIVIRSNALDPARPVAFGDGLRCISSTPLVRLAATTALGGASVHAIGHGAAAGSGVFYYQVWFRNTPSTFCDAFAAYNLSNGRALVWP